MLALVFAALVSSTPSEPPPYVVAFSENDALLAQATLRQLEGDLEGAYRAYTRLARMNLAGVDAPLQIAFRDGTVWVGGITHVPGDAACAEVPRLDAPEYPDELLSVREPGSVVRWMSLRTQGDVTLRVIVGESGEAETIEVRDVSIAPVFRRDPFEEVAARRLVRTQLALAAIEDMRARHFAETRGRFDVTRSFLTPFSLAERLPGAPVVRDTRARIPRHLQNRARP